MVLLTLPSVDHEDEGEGSGSGSGSSDEEDVDVKMDKKPVKPVVSNDPADLSAFKMDEYDEEESQGIGAYCSWFLQASVH